MTRTEAIEILNRDDDSMRKGYFCINDFKAIEVLKSQEIIPDQDCEHCSKTRGTLGCCSTVSNKWVYSCKEGQREYLLSKIRAEISQLEEGISSYHNDRPWVFKDEVLQIIDKYKAGGE